MAYQPMVELLAYLRANGFRTFIVSGGGVEFIRAFAEETYGIVPEQVICTQIKLKYELRDGMPVLVRLAELRFYDDREGEPAAIQTAIGRRPIAAFGNSDGDLQMLQWTSAGSGARLALIVLHTDADREWVSFAGENGVQYRLAAEAGDVAQNMADLDIHLAGRLLHVQDVLGSHLQ